MFHTSEEITQTRGNLEDEKKKIIKRKENKFNFSQKIALHSLKCPFINRPAWSITVLNKQSCILVKQTAVVWSSQKTDDHNRAPRTWER